ncbi:hypothetical protein GLOTRDRAFT_134612 [Gloeophyllum trabeum ATCC 11539]|uniref:Uncharacterized protein n=1 Tax=Gloeophyllum trabeum (strain ATCC 11539 / FP-39264 / Madison 617) TaxID=670483 RepID=S7R5X6_GLOTA|nr:uncharacterized protein GLOTRDRAFT_134612 [Gloeophyllum trabeum ATCC 11539]EPQ49785.1 hypothetical protein GLOTRDRAFT_134612 [Gloeophyllum trabeum ATCC 11539]
MTSSPPSYPSRAMASTLGEADAPHPDSSHTQAAVSFPSLPPGFLQQCPALDPMNPFQGMNEIQYPSFSTAMAHAQLQMQYAGNPMYTPPAPAMQFSYQNPQFLLTSPVDMLRQPFRQTSNTELTI